MSQNRVRGIRKNEALLWIGGWTSKFGNLVFDYANNVTIVNLIGKPWVLAMYQSAETLIQILFNLIGGAKADHGNRKRLVIVTDLIAACICALLGLFIGSGWMAQVMIVANALLAIVYAFNSPTYKALVREVIERDRIGFANSIAHAGGEMIGLIGPVIGVMLVGLIGARGAMWFDAGTFLVSALLEMRLTGIASEAFNDSPKQKESVLGQIGAGFRYLWGEKHILFLLILAAFVNFFLAGYNLLLPYMDRVFAAEVPHFYGKALSVSAVGGIAGAFLCSKVLVKLQNRVRTLLLCLLGTGLSLLLEPVLAKHAFAYLALLPFGLFSMALAGFNILFMSHVQIAVDPEYLSRVFSIIFTVAVLFMPCGSFVCAHALDLQRVESFYVIGGGISLVTLAYLFICYHSQHSLQ